MKIELINENQIKCTLTRSDLASHQIKLSELAYGTEKTKDLFQDMMDQAFSEFGFEASDPLMIEAIPVSMDCIILMITKVDDPEELDQDFATPSFSLDSNDDTNAPDGLESLVNTIVNAAIRKTESIEKIFSFDDINMAISFAHKAAASFKGKSALYRSTADGRYYITLDSSSKSVNDFAAVCSLALEYGSREPSGFARSAFFSEHFETIIAVRALQKLADV